MTKPTEKVYEVSGNEFVDAQTRKIEKEFKTSRPRPRNRAMGFKGEKSNKRNPWSYSAI